MSLHCLPVKSPANLILSTITCNSSHTTKLQHNYSFDYIAPRNWNSLLDIVGLAPSVLTFRKRLKTYFFLASLFSSIDTVFLLADLLDYDLFHYI